jgi:hypothetical protein
MLTAVSIFCTTDDSPTLSVKLLMRTQRLRRMRGMSALNGAEKEGRKEKPAEASCEKSVWRQSLSRVPHPRQVLLPFFPPHKTGRSCHLAPCLSSRSPLLPPILFSGASLENRKFYHFSISHFADSFRLGP